MKAADMWAGQEVAVKHYGHEPALSWKKATIVRVANEEGHAQRHKVRFADTGDEDRLPARRIMMPWSTYMDKYGEEVEQVEQDRANSAFKAKVRAQLEQIQKDQADRIALMFQVLGMPSSVVRTYNWEPGSDDSFAFYLQVHNLDLMEKLVEPLVQAKVFTQVPVDTGSDNEES